MKGVKKRDGSGRGRRFNAGRGGCETIREIGQGMSDRVRRILRRD